VLAIKGKVERRHNPDYRVKGTKPAAGRSGVNFDKLDKEYLANNIEIWPKGIAGDIVIAIIIDDQNIVLTVAASPSLSMWNC
jgi:hypothetical protein